MLEKTVMALLFQPQHMPKLEHGIARNAGVERQNFIHAHIKAPGNRPKIIAIAHFEALRRANAAIGARF